MCIRLASAPVFLFATFLLSASAVLGAQDRGAGFRPDSPSGDMPYVIVTTQKLAPPFQPLAAWKTKFGLPAQVVTVEAIAYDPRNAGTDLAEKVRSFLRRAHENWNTRWVLLGGHVTEVPSRATH
ncbi:MAG: C25 family cysteine peptidase, partial [Planctomycetota bacterium]